MNYSVFKEKLITELKKLFPESEISEGEVSKNNTTFYDTVTIRAPGQIISPCIRLNDYYRRFNSQMENERSFAKVLEGICDEYWSTLEHTGYKDKIINEITNFNDIKDHITCRLVNRAMNQALLDTMPHENYLGEFAVIYSVIIKQGDEGVESVRITNSLMNHWKISSHDLYELALNNTVKLFPKVSMPMEDMIRSMIGAPMPEREAEVDMMYILTNEQGINGATVLLYPGLLKEFLSQYGIKERYLYILPSSIHEVILVPTENLSMTENYRQMVRDVNNSEVAADEILSNQIIIYDCNEDTIQCLVKEEE